MTLENSLLIHHVLNTIRKLKHLAPIVFILTMACIQPAFAEGTKQLEPTDPSTTVNRRTRLIFDQNSSQHRTPFATINCAERYRLNIYINDPSTEKIYIGLNDGTETIFYQIKDPDGVVVSGFTLSQIPVSGPGFISTYDQAYAGPKIGTINPTGYDPKILTPLKVGNYYIEFAPNTTGGSFSGQSMLFFDISVVDGSTVKNGRLWSKAWQLSDDASGDVIKSYPSKLFIYTDNGIVTSLNINEWNGGTYTVYCNQWGVKNTNNWAVDRMSTVSWPGSDLPQYKIFLNNPDINVFPTGELGNICEMQTHPYCNGTVDIMARVNKPGSLTLSLDISPAGPGPEDVELNSDVDGSATCDVWDTITWNGMDGNGNPVQNGTAVTIKSHYLNGLTNLPLWDVEDNTSGLIVNIVRPLPPLVSTKLPVFWDDDNLPGGTVNSLTGCIYPSSLTVSGCHNWISQNENMINTWWYFSDEFPDINVAVIRNPLADFSYNNNCSGTTTIFTDQSLIPGGYPIAWHWDFGLFGDTSDLQNPSYSFPNIGNQIVHLRVTSNDGCQANISKTVLIQTAPVPDAGIDKLIPYGFSTTLQGTATGGSGNFSYHWEPAGLLLNPDILDPVTVNLFETTDFILTVTDLGNGCETSDIVKVTVTGGPLGVQVSAQPDSICSGSGSLINLQASGGSGTYTYAWSSNPPGFTSNQEDITVQPLVTTTYTVVVNDGFSTVNHSITIAIYTDPSVDAGNNQTIPFGTSTSLSGNATLGMPPYSYVWSPTNLVLSPHQINTLTTILSATTNFTLSVTDGHGCSASDQVQVIITGSALMASPRPEKNPICYGESTHLIPLPQGGSGNYIYTWTDGNGFISNIENPEVSPLQTTTYHLVINDGYTSSSSETILTVDALPVINLIPEGAHVVSTDTIVACVFDTLTLSAAGPNRTYLWSNGATTSQIQSSTTGIGFDLQSYTVNVLNTLTGCSNTAALSIMFTYAECSYGIFEGGVEPHIIISPNPGKGIYYCSIEAQFPEMFMEVVNLYGVILHREHLKLTPGSVRNINVDITGNPTGVYLLKFYNNSFQHVVKIIKY
jgi:PKD repeat protein